MNSNSNFLSFFKQNLIFFEFISTLMSEWIKKPSKLSLELIRKGAIAIFPTTEAALTFFFHAAFKIR